MGSLLQTETLLDARRAHEESTISAAELTRVEDDAVLAAISLQQDAGLDVITDGELRRTGWADTARHLHGIEPRENAPRAYPANIRLMAQGVTAGAAGRGQPTVVGRVTPRTDLKVGEEYPFLHRNAVARTKYTMAAPSYHRRYWSDTVSKQESPYNSCEEFLTDVRDWLASVAAWLVSEGCTYIQLDAPNYGSLCDPDNRAWHAEQGHDIPAELAFDAALDSSVFDGLAVTGALHICRGNTPGGHWHSTGGYHAIAEDMFPNLNVDVALLEYDSDRAGDFGPIELLRPGTVAVLGLLTTKDGSLEDEKMLEGRVEEASGYRAFGDLALSTQCGFASAANAPMSPDEQRAKLELVAKLAHRFWAS